MHERLRELHAACLPFVTRALRGPARRRFALVSALLAMMVVLLGMWIGRSPSFPAHDMRVSLGLETNRWNLERDAFVVFVEDERERRQVLGQEGQRRENGPRRWSPLIGRSQEAWTLLDVAAGPHVIPPRDQQALHYRAQELRNARIDLAPLDLEQRRSHHRFSWWSEQDRQRLKAIVDAELVPTVVVYASPLDAAATARIVGGLAASLLLVLLTVVAPLWVGVQLAQELHENTLQPLTGTALTARQLVVGLVAGPLAPVAIVAIPQLAILLLTALTAGRVVPALGAVAMGTAMGAMLVGLAMLTALAVGRRRAPGIVGISLLAMLGIACLAGLGFGMNLQAESLGLVAILPGAGPVHLACEAFFPQAFLSGVSASALDLRLGLASVGAVVLAALALRALERCVGGTHRSGALTTKEALVAAAVLAGLAVAAIPARSSFGETFLVSLALALVPMQLVLMGRVPGGDAPPQLRRVPIARLLGEHAIWLGMVLVLAFMVEGPPRVSGSGSFIGVLHLGWALVIVALVTLRAVARPTSVMVKLWLAICLLGVMIEYMTGAMWCMSSLDADQIFPMGQAHPLLGLLQVAMIVWMPVSLVRGLATQESVAHATTVRDEA
jgi:hypothetical protein